MRLKNIMEAHIYKAKDRGTADFGWLKANYSFSFSNYYNSANIHFGALRVLNDDIIAPGMGFDTHPHDNMEIVTIPLSGALRHVDSIGHMQVVGVHDVQVMSAGTGISHSEFNNSSTYEANTLQLWIFTDKKEHTPRYDQKSFSEKDMQNCFQLMVGPRDNIAPLWINQNAWLSRGKFIKCKSIRYELKSERNGIYIFMIDGKVQIDNKVLDKRDAISIVNSSFVDIQIIQKSDILVVEVPV